MSNIHSFIQIIASSKLSLRSVGIFKTNLIAISINPNLVSYENRSSDKYLKENKQCLYRWLNFNLMFFKSIYSFLIIGIQLNTLKI